MRWTERASGVAEGHIEKAAEISNKKNCRDLGNGKQWKGPPFLMGKWQIHYFDWAIFYVANCECLPGRVIVQGVSVGPMLMQEFNKSP